MRRTLPIAYLCAAIFAEAPRLAVLAYAAAGASRKNRVMRQKFTQDVRAALRLQRLQRLQQRIRI